MSTPNSQFYVVGGTVSPDSPSYIVRRADQELFDRMLAGDFCYVLTSRQMGKSSLMARTARRLTDAGVHTAIVDLTQVGTEKEKQSADRWYYGIAHRILRELQIRDVNLSEWWQSRQNLPALQRLMEIFSDIILEKIDDKVAIFIDEIDSTISLPFTDDFFAAIRACFNARATEANYNRLSFVLLGVASPSDLVKDPMRTPFNIGHRIEMTDFTLEEAARLGIGLSADIDTATAILMHIYYWTDGHPYLTQKLCEEARTRNRHIETLTEKDVKSLVEKVFLSPTATYEDSNLCFVRDWLTKNYDKSSLLPRKVASLYVKIYSGESVPDSPLSMEQAELKLAGLVKRKGDHTLCVRNRIYKHVFTPKWAASASDRVVYDRIILIIPFFSLVAYVCSFYASHWE